VAITAAAARRLRVYWRLKQVECRIRELNYQVHWGKYINNQIRRQLGMLDQVDALLLRRADLFEIERAKKWSANRAQSDGQLPSIFYFALIILPHQRRADMLMDIWDWHAEALRDHGRLFAYLACTFKIIGAWVGTALDFMLRAAEIVGKFRGAK
jgi:hypothetical protein